MILWKTRYGELFQVSGADFLQDIESDDGELDVEVQMT